MSKPNGPLPNVTFKSVDGLEPGLQFLLSCGFIPDLARAKRPLETLGGDAVVKLRVPGAGFTALDWAARKGNFEIAEWVASDPRTRSLVTTSTPIGWACYTNHVKLAKILVSHGVVATATHPVLFGNQSPLLIAAENSKLLAM
jgi:hypothetical protein